MVEIKKKKEGYLTKLRKRLEDTYAKHYLAVYEAAIELGEFTEKAKEQLLEVCTESCSASVEVGAKESYTSYKNGVNQEGESKPSKKKALSLKRYLSDDAEDEAE